MKKRAWGIGLGSALAVVAVAAAIGLGAGWVMPGQPGPAGAVPGGASTLAPSEALTAESADAGAPSAASRYEAESADVFADAMHIVDGAGNALALGDVPASDYTGFLFQIADTAAGAGDVAGKLAEAVEQGTVQQVHGSLYRAESLDVLAGLLTADQVEYVEPDFKLHLMGDIDDNPASARADEALDGLSADEKADTASADDREGAEAEAVPDAAPAEALAESPAGTDGSTSTVESASVGDNVGASGNANAGASEPAAQTGAPEPAAQTGASGNANAGALESSAQAEGALLPQGGTAANPAPDWPVNDEAYDQGKLYHLDMLNVRGAWEAGLDGDPYYYNGKPLHADADGNATPVKVAVIDTGLYGTGAGEEQHEDLDYAHMESGYDYIHDTADTTPDAQGHGTFVAGLIAAQANNGLGVAGLTPGVTIVSEKVFDTGSASTADVISGIYHAVDVDKVDVINMSLGGEYNERTLESACDYAVEQGVIVVASAGNDGVSTPNYPAAYDSVVGVASINSSNQRSSWSQYGKSVFVTAYGEAVTSTFIGSATAYKTASGTSFSGPEVAALAAMCRAVYPDMDQDTFKQFLIQTSTDMGTAGYDDYFGYGRVDFAKMAETVLASQVLPYYDVTFDVVDEAGKPVEGAQVSLVAAEDIAWDANDVEGIEAGTWPEGTAIAQQDGSWAAGVPAPAADAYRLHRGTYAYTVVCDGNYTATGTFKTYTQRQTVPVRMQTAYETSVTVVDGAGAPLSSTLKVVSAAGRQEMPKSQAGATSVFDLASGSYAYDAQAEGYEGVSGSFMVQRSNSQVNIALYRADELAYISFDCVDADGGATVGGKPSIAVYDASGNVVDPSEPGRYRLAKGKTYAAVASKAGYEDVRQEFTVGADDAQIVTLRMTKARFAITFDVQDLSGNPVTTAVIDVADERGEAMPANADNPYRFNLNGGNYSFKVEAPGYDEQQGSFAVSNSSYTRVVQLAPRSYTVSFVVTDAQTGEPVEGFTSKVSKAGLLRAIAPNADGTYSLVPGDYSYLVYKEGYELASADFRVTDADLAMSVGLTARTATEVSFAGGSGTADDPYLIANEEQLRYLAEQTAIVRMTRTDAESNKRGEVGGFYRLIDDIELHGEWTPIGNCEFVGSNYMAFTGTFDGAGHTVSGLQINNTYDYQGLFGFVYSATITDLTVEGSVHCDGRSFTSGGAYVGGLVGGLRAANDELYTGSNTGPTTIERCCSRVNVTGRYSVGGIVGSAQMALPSTGLPEDLLDSYYVNIVECANLGDVSAAYLGEFARNSSAAGGIVGSGQLVGLTACYNAGRVQAGYCAGGIMGRGNYTGLFSCYSSGQVMQYMSGSGYSSMTGALLGTSAKVNAADSYALRRDDNYLNELYGSGDSVSSFTACGLPEYDDMYRTDSFVAAVNANTPAGTARTSYVLGRDFPLLHWQVQAGAPLAPMPRFVEQPQGVAQSAAYKQGEAAEALYAEVADVSEGDVSWQWYVSDYPNGADAQVLSGAAGTGLAATYVPSTEEVGVRYYLVEFTNTVYRELEQDSAVARSNAAAVYVRTVADAQTPSITALNPSQTSDFNTSLTVNQASDLELEVRAEVGDGGELSYQWFQAPAQDDATATAIAGATGRSYRVDTSTEGSYYYFVKVTNTTGYGNSSTAISDWITVTVDANRISTYEELAAFRDTVNSGTSYAGLTVTLTDDIAIPEGVDWTPIGTREHPFAGTFQGSSARPGTANESIEVHTVSGLSVDGDSLGGAYLGLFGFTYGASFYDVQVQGSISGAANKYAGLLVGYAHGGTGEAGIGNCAALSGSSVEGKYLIGGLIGYGNVSIENCANHAGVTARAYVYDAAVDADANAVDFKSVGGVVGRAGGSRLAWSYNDGAVSVDAIEGSANRCASAVGGVVGYADSSSVVVSCYNAGTVTVGSMASNVVTEPQKVRYAGAVAGYLVAGANLHYLEGTCECGASGSTGQEYADLHSARFMDTDYFANMMNTGYPSYTSSQFTQSAGAAPHLAWEVDASTPREVVQSAEPWMNDLEWADVPDVTSTWAGTLYQGYEPAPIYLLVDSPDGGALTVKWQMREPGGTDDDWQDAPGGTIELSAEDSVEGKAGFTFPADVAGTLEYRVVAVNKRADVAEADDAAEDDRTTVAPPITVTVKSSEGLLAKADPAQPSSADNPWLVETPEQLKFLADVVNGSEPYFHGVADTTFKGEYVQLANDLDLSAYVNWMPIGFESGGYHRWDFQGTFDGAGHTVGGLVISSDNEMSAYDYQGLFGALSGATVKNLAVEGDVNVQGGNAIWIGGVAGYAVNSTFANVVNRVNVTANSAFGGVCGYAGGCTFENCENAGAITINEASFAATYGQRGIGGIVGRSFDTRTTKLVNCYNAGLVTARSGADGEYYFGALLGAGAGTLSNCFYQEGSVVDADHGAYEPTGRGGSAAGPMADAAGKAMPVAARGDVAVAGEAAWKLNTSDGANATSRLWGAYAQAGADAQAHLVMGDDALVTYRVDAASEAADIQVSPAYATAGQAVEVSWKAKPGFTVKSVSWKAAGASDDAQPIQLGTGDASSAPVSFAMPADDVAVVAEAEHDESYRYELASAVVLDGSAAPAKAGAVKLESAEEGRALAGETVGVTIAVSQGYEVYAVQATGLFGTPVDVKRVDGLHYRFAMPAENVTVTVELARTGASAAELAPSLPVTEAALHRAHSGDGYASANLLYDTVAFSGSLFGAEGFYQTAELEALGRTGTAGSAPAVALYEQDYTFADGTAHRYTGHDLAALVKRLNGQTAPADDTPVIIETRDGGVHRFTYGDIASKAYNAYGDATGQPTTRGLPVLLYYGVDGLPSTQGAIGVVFGQQGAADDNAANCLQGVTRICVGDDVNYSQHVWGRFADMDAISGGKANATNGYTDLHVRVYRGSDATGELISEDVLSLADIEALARADRSGVQRGTYSTVLYEDREKASDGPYADYYEGYDLMTLLERMGVYYVDASMANRTKVQFYQTGMYGLDRSYKTVNVSLAYLAGNGAAGKGDYSNNTMTYVTGSDGVAAPGTGTMTGLRPMLVYGKNGLPLVWSSGEASAYAYNYRGPMMAFLPQNQVEGGSHVGSQTATTCYLALIDVYVPEDVDYPDRASEQSKTTLAAAADKANAVTEGIAVSKDGADVKAGEKWATQAAVDALAKAVDKARSVASNPAATVEQVSAANEQLQAAVKAFEASLQTQPALTAGKWATSKDGVKFYGDKDGNPTKGFATIAGKAYFFDRATGALTTGFFTDGGKRYYADGSGALQTGKFKVGSSSYYADKAGALQTGWIQAGSAWYYANAKYVLVKGAQTIDGAPYWFDESTCAAKSGLFTAAGKRYYAGAKGLLKTGLFTVGSATYYANAGGVLQTGPKTVAGKKYYFDSKSYAAKSGLFKAGASTYYANAGGVLQTGLIQVGESSYYANAGGVLQAGFKTVSGKRYYFAAKTFAAKAGKFKAGKKYYYATKKGVLKTGLFKAGAAYYYASKKGVLQTGFKTVKGKRYYFDKKTCKAKTGKFKVGKKSYYGSEKGFLKTGLFKAGKKYYYATGKGVLKAGFKTVSGKRYYFAAKTFAAKAGKFKVGKRYYYATKKGVIKTGKFTVSKKTYYASKKGVLQKGFIKVGKATYYANSKYVLQSGWKKIAGKYYYFYKKSHKMAKSTWIGKYYVNSNGVRTKKQSGTLMAASL